MIVCLRGGDWCPSNHGVLLWENGRSSGGSPPKPGPGRAGSDAVVLHVPELLVWIQFCGGGDEQAGRASRPLSSSRRTHSGRARLLRPAVVTLRRFPVSLNTPQPFPSPTTTSLSSEIQLWPWKWTTDTTGKPFLHSRLANCYHFLLSCFHAVWHWRVPVFMSVWHVVGPALCVNHTRK